MVEYVTAVPLRKILEEASVTSTMESTAVAAAQSGMFIAPTPQTQRRLATGFGTGDVGGWARARWARAWMAGSPSAGQLKRRGRTWQAHDLEREQSMHAFRRSACFVVAYLSGRGPFGGLPVLVETWVREGTREGPVHMAVRHCESVQHAVQQAQAPNTLLRDACVWPSCP